VASHGGDIYVADGDSVLKFSFAGAYSLFAGSGGRSPFSLPQARQGNATDTDLASPEGLVLDAAGNVYIADTGNHVVRKVDPAGRMTILAGDGVPCPRGGFDARAVKAIVQQDACGDGGPALQAHLTAPSGIALHSGDLYIADRLDQRVRRVSASGIITTVAGNGTQGFAGDGGPAAGAALDSPTGVAVDPHGVVYVADAGNHRIRRIDRAGLIDTVAGGKGGFGGDGGRARVALLSYPQGVALDGAGNLFVADTGNNRVRRIDRIGRITTVAGTGDAAFSGDGGRADDAELASPSAVALTAHRELLIADTGNGRIRFAIAQHASPAPPVRSFPPRVLGRRLVRRAPRPIPPSVTSLPYMWGGPVASAAGSNGPQRGRVMPIAFAIGLAMLSSAAVGTRARSVFAKR
jgi:sugar lactone lactonase YvrE